MGLADSLGQQSDAQKQQALQALADAGTRGLTGYKQAQSQITDLQQKALADAGQAGGVGTFGSTVMEPGNLAQQRLAESQGIYTQDLERRKAALGAYFDSSKANAQLVQSNTDAQVALAQQAADAAAAARASRGSGGGGGGKAKPQYTDTQLKTVAAGLADMAAAQQRQEATQQTQQQQNDALWASADFAGLVGTGNIEQAPAAQQAPEAPSTPAHLSDLERMIAEAGLQGGGPGGSGGVGGTSWQADYPTQAPDPRQAIDEHIAAQYEAANKKYQTAAALEQSWALDQGTQNKRDAYQAMTGDPYLAAGLFPRQDPQSKLQDVLDEQKQQQQLAAAPMSAVEQARQEAYFKETGFKTPAEQLAWQNAQTNLTADPQDRQIAQQLGMDPQQVSEARNTDSYRTGVAVVEELLKNGSGVKDANDQEMPVSEDLIHSALAQAGMSPQVIALVVADSKPYLYSSGYRQGTPIAPSGG